MTLSKQVQTNTMIMELHKASKLVANYRNVKSALVNVSKRAKINSRNTSKTTIPTWCMDDLNQILDLIS